MCLVSRARRCLRLNANVGDPVCSGCLKQVRHRFKSWTENLWKCELNFSSIPSGLSEWQRSLLPDFFSSSWSVDNKLAAELCSRWQCQKDKLTCRYFIAQFYLEILQTHIKGYCECFVCLGGPDSQLRHPVLWTLGPHLSMRARWVKHCDSCV